MQSRRIIIAAVPMAVLARPRAAKALVKGYKPDGPQDPQDPQDPMDPVVSDPVQYDIEQLMGEVDGLKRRMDGTDLAFNLLAIQVMITGVFSAWMRR
jgi:hypothetical protein